MDEQLRLYETDQRLFLTDETNLIIEWGETKINSLHEMLSEVCSDEKRKRDLPFHFRFKKKHDFYPPGTIVTIAASWELDRCIVESGSEEDYSIFVVKTASLVSPDCYLRIAREYKELEERLLDGTKASALEKELTGIKNEFKEIRKNYDHQCRILYEAIEEERRQSCEPQLKDFLRRKLKK
jgi:hypothetical protein